MQLLVHHNETSRHKADKNGLRLGLSPPIPIFLHGLRSCECSQPQLQVAETIAILKSQPSFILFELRAYGQSSSTYLCRVLKAA